MSLGPTSLHNLKPSFWENQIFSKPKRMVWHLKQANLEEKYIKCRVALIVLNILVVGPNILKLQIHNSDRELC